MPNVTALPRTLENGRTLTQFTDTTSTSAVTYTYPTQQTGIQIENSGEKDIFVTVGSYTNQLVKADTKWKATVSFTSFSISSVVNSQEFIATTFIEATYGTVKQVNGAIPDANGNVTIPIPQVDTSTLATKTEVNSVASGSPKGAYTTLSALQTAFSTGNTNIYVVTADGNWYYWSGSSWVSGGVYQSTGIGNESLTVEKYADKSIRGYKTDFLTMGVNLFDKSDVITGGYYNRLTGAFGTNASYSSSGFIKVEAGSQYALNFASKGGVAGDITCWNKDKVVVSPGIASGWTSPITIPSGVTYVTLPYANSSDLDQIMFVKGTTLPTTTVPFGYTLDSKVTVTKDSIATASVSYEKTDYLNTQQNLFDKAAIITGGYYTGWTPTWANNAAYNSSDFIPAELGKTYNIPVKGTKGDICFWDKNKVGINAITITANSWSGSITVPNNTSIKYLTFPLDSTENLTVLMVGDASNYPPVYLSYGQKLLSFKNNGLLYGGSLASTQKTLGKSALIFGDSITETANVSDDGATYNENSAWTNWITYSKVTLQLGQVWNYAKFGATYKDRTVDGTNVVTRQLISTQINTAIANNRPADIIVIAMGTNDGSASLGDYNTAMSKTTLASLDKTLLYEAIRWSFWRLREQYPDAMCFAATPIQRADSDQPQTLIDAITKMANRYNFILIDAHNQSGIIRDFEVPSAAGRFLADGLHPNTAGKQKMANLYSRLILNSMNY